MKLKLTVYKQSGKYYDEVYFDVTDEQIERLKTSEKYGYGFEGVTEYIEENCQYSNKMYHFHVELEDQPNESRVFCQYLSIAGKPRLSKDEQRIAPGIWI